MNLRRRLFSRRSPPQPVLRPMVDATRILSDRALYFIEIAVGIAAVTRDVIEIASEPFLDADPPPQGVKIRL